MCCGNIDLSEMMFSDVGGDTGERDETAEWWGERGHCQPGVRLLSLHPSGAHTGLHHHLKAGHAGQCSTLTALTFTCTDSHSCLSEVLVQVVQHSLKIFFAMLGHWNEICNGCASEQHFILWVSFIPFCWIVLKRLYKVIPNWNYAAVYLLWLLIELCSVWIYAILCRSKFVENCTLLTLILLSIPLNKFYVATLNWHDCR